MTTITDTERNYAAQLLDELPTRTLNRSVESIFATNRRDDIALQNMIVTIAMGDRVAWSLADSNALLIELRTTRRTLCDWLNEIETGDEDAQN